MCWRNFRNHFQFLDRFWLWLRSKEVPTEKKLVETNVLEQLKTSLQELSDQLEDQNIRDAIASVPANIMNPVIEGFKTVLNNLKKSLTEVEGKLDSVANLQELLGTVNNLLAVSEGLAPKEKDSLESVKNMAITLEALPDRQERSQILTLIDHILSQLEAL